MIVATDEELAEIVLRLAAIDAPLVPVGPMEEPMCITCDGGMQPVSGYDGPLHVPDDARATREVFMHEAWCPWARARRATGMPVE